MLHPQEAVLQEARAFQWSEAFAPYRTLRQVAEHRLARLIQLGRRQVRYVGRAKTLGQLLMATTVGPMRTRSRRQQQLCAPIFGLVVRLITTWRLSVARSLQRWATAQGARFSATLLASAGLGRRAVTVVG